MHLLLTHTGHGRASRQEPASPPQSASLLHAPGLPMVVSPAAPLWQRRVPGCAKMREKRLMLMLASPVAGSSVPLASVANTFWRQVGAGPPGIGRGGPK